MLYLGEGKDAESFQKHKIWNFRGKVRYREKSKGGLKSPLKILRSKAIKWFKKRVLNKIKMYDLKQYSWKCLFILKNQ